MVSGIAEYLSVCQPGFASVRTPRWAADPVNEHAGPGESVHPANVC
jgi:hypothetical protein